MSGIYLPYQKPPRWNIDRATIAYNCARLGLPMPVLAMPMWEGAGNKAYDYSGNQNHGDVIGATWQGGNLDFNGSSDYIDCGDSPFQLANGTISVRFKADTKAAWDTVVGKDQSGYHDDLLLGYYLNANTFSFVIEESGGSSSKICNSDTELVTGTWYHVVATWGNAGMKLYVDGVQQTNTNPYTGGIVSSGNNLYIGCLEVSNHCFDGQINEVIILDVALISAQVQTLRNNLFGVFEQIRSPQWIVPLGVTTAAPTTVAPTTAAPTTTPATTSAPTTPTYTTIGPTTVPVATTPPSTTVVPTTLAPTSLAPTTLPSTTPAPPTTLAPTTVAPTTLAPTTAAPADIRSAQVLAQVEWVEHVPTTAAPTTIAPTTLASTTLAPTSLAPTTLLPTTLAPTTIAATTPAPPTTLFQTTIGPTTKAPSTGPATTVSPTTEPFTTSIPTTVAPTTLQPTTFAPTTTEPTTLAPTTQVPTTLALTTLIPTTLGPTVPPTTNIPELICIKNLRSVITKEIRSDGYLC